MDHLNICIIISTHINKLKDISNGVSKHMYHFNSCQFILKEVLNESFNQIVIDIIDKTGVCSTLCTI